MVLSKKKDMAKCGWVKVSDVRAGFEYFYSSLGIRHVMVLKVYAEVFYCEVFL